MATMNRTELTTQEPEPSELLGWSRSKTGRGTSATEDFWARHARELHDGVTQEVWYLQAELSSLEDRVPQGQEELRADVRRLAEIAQGAYQELRETLRLINSHTGTRVDIGSEIRELTRKFSQMLGMEIEFRSIPRQARIEAPSDVGRNIRRLVQEALWNSWRHSSTDGALVTIRHTKIGLVIAVSDTGVGFRVDEVDRSHYGLRNMRERAESINGKLYVTSRSGRGTVVTLRVPLEALDMRAQGGR